MDVTTYFRLGQSGALRILADVAVACGSWRQVAERAGASGEEISLMRSAFETEQTDVAARLVA